MELACITDAGFARHTGAMLHSVLSRTTPERCSIHVLHGGDLPVDTGERLQAVARRFGAALTLVAVPIERAALFPAGYFPRSVWYRVLLPELMPHADKVLYLDSDMVAADSLQPLWQVDLGDHLLGAVTNPFYPFMPPHAENLGLAPGDYFNSGMLLMNLAAMRAHGTLTRCIEFARAQPHAAYPDQDALNLVCRGRWLPLHPRWNAQSTLFELPAASLPWPPGEVDHAVRKPALVHFIGPFKPWHYLCRHPRQRDYLEAAAQTPWGVPTIEGRNVRNRILRRLPLQAIDAWLALERRITARWAQAFRRVRAVAARS